MKKKNVNPELKSNVVSGMSSAIGSAAGVVMGNVLTAEVEAMQTVMGVAEDASAPIEVGEQTISEASFADDEQEVNVVISEPTTTPVSHTVEEPEAKPTVMSYETVTNDNGDKMDVAVIDVEGQPVGIIDANQDGVADIALADLNGNGELDEGEMKDISELGIDMQQLQNATTSDGDLTAQTAETDYVNDANVDNYYT